MKTLKITLLFLTLLLLTSLPAQAVTLTPSKDIDITYLDNGDYRDNNYL